MRITIRIWLSKKGGKMSVKTITQIGKLTSPFETGIQIDAGYFPELRFWEWVFPKTGENPVYKYPQKRGYCLKSVAR